MHGLSHYPESTPRSAPDDVVPRQARRSLKSSGSQQSVCVNGIARRRAHRQRLMLPSTAMRHGECSAVIGRLDADGWPDEEPVLPPGPGLRFFHRHRRPRCLAAPQGSGLFIQLQHGASTREIRFRVLDMLPGMVTPGTNLLGCKPAANGAGRERRQARSSRHRACQGCTAPMSQRDSMRSR